MGLCDAVICGGADTLCRLATNGFHALEATASERCLPFSRARRGINIGEAAALFLMTRETAPVALLGGGASSDAYHMSSPEPGGRGASEAMRRALSAAGIVADTIDYVNLHGTATEHNDAMESHAVAATFAHAVRLLVDQGADRAHAGCGRRAGSGVLLAGIDRCATAPAAACMGWRGRSGAATPSHFTRVSATRCQPAAGTS